MLVMGTVLSGATARSRTRRGMLLSSVFYGIGLSSFGVAAHANDAAIGGVDCPLCVLADGRVSVPGGFSEVDINVDTAIGAPGAPALGVGVYAYSTEAITVTADQDITTTDRTMWLDSNSVVAGQGAITVTSGGALTSTLSRGVEILQPAAEVLLDGQGTGSIKGATDGVAFLGYLNGGTQEIRGFESIIGGTNSVYVLSLGADTSIQNVGQVGDATGLVDGIYVDAKAGGNIDIGGQTALGSVQGGDDGLELYTSGAGTITVNLGDATGADWGIYAIGVEGDANITATGAVEGTGDVGIETRTTSGNITIDANDVTGGTWGIYALSTEGDASIAATGNVEGKSAVGIETRTSTGNIAIDANDVTGGTWGIYARSTSGDNAISVAGDVSGGTAMAIDTITTTGNVTIDGSGTATAMAGDVGIWAGTGGGDVTVQNFDTVTSVDTGVFTYSAGGDISVTGVGAGGGITSSAVDGINASTQSGDGNVLISNNGAIVGADDGIEAYVFGNGTMTVGITDDVTGGEFGVYTRAVAGDTNLTVDGGTVEGTSASGIDAFALTGGITATGSNSATLQGALRGIRTETEGGDIAITGFDTIASDTTAVEAFSFGGNIAITGNGLAGGITGTAVDGIFASGEATSGNVLISGNGAITGGDDGIEAYAFGDGSMTVGIAEDVTGGEFGIYSRAADGDTNITVDGGTVEGTSTTGIDALSTGAGKTAIAIADGATVQGALFGLVTGSGVGAQAASVTNAGVIRDNADTGSAETAGGDAYWSWTGSTVLDNEGDILGRLHSDGAAFTFNNLDGGEWFAGTGLNPFDSLSDSLNNAGTVFVREGLTTFSGLENFDNMAGGHINLSYNTAATDTLTVLNLTSREGSRLSFDFDAMADNNAGLGFDDSTDALGTADTIVVTGTANADAGALVSVNHVNGDPEGLTGSVALIYTGTDLDAPDPGDQIDVSDVYAFDTPLTFTTIAYHLVDDGNGGLYYQWTPNLTSDTLGAYAGGDMDDPDAADAGIAAAGASFAGLGGLGTSGGGVTGAITDRAASAVRQGSGVATVAAAGGQARPATVAAAGGQTRQERVAAAGGQANPEDRANLSSNQGGLGDLVCQRGRDTNIWYHADGSTTSGDNYDGDSFSTTFGYEHDLGEVTKQACGRMVGGVFAGVGQTSLSWGTGASNGSNVMAGAYLRYASPEGLYASGTIAKIWSETDLVNGVFGSTASQSSTGYAGLAAIGYVMPLSPAGSIDWRADLSYGVVDGASFTDSAGIVVDDTQSQVTTAGISGAYWHQIDDASEGFVKAGMRWTEASREVTAFDDTIDGTSSATVGLLAAGISTELSDRSTLDLAIHGTFTDTSSTIGGSIGFKLVF